MGIKGRRRSANARAFEPDPATVSSKKRQPLKQQQLASASTEPLNDAVCVTNTDDQQLEAAHDEQLRQSPRKSTSASSLSASSSTRPRVVSIVRRKRRGVGAIAAVRYSDGSRYEGQTIEEDTVTHAESDAPTLLRHGKGVYVTHNGHVFDGEWVHGIFQGFGSQTFARTGDRHEGQYHKNQRHGIGTYVWANGDKYVGNWRHGKMHGDGYFLWDHGDSYDGEWKKGMMHGRGRKIFANGDVLDGMWRKNEASGVGCKRFVSGDVFVGAFVCSDRCGYGTYTWANGATHEGAWRNGVLHGAGVFTSAATDGSNNNYSTVQGTWQHGVLSGNGIERFACGAVYTGGFAHDKRHGVGVLTLATGDVFEGDWVDDRIDGHGAWLAIDGRQFIGDWIDGVPHGSGLFSFAETDDDERDNDDDDNDEEDDGDSVHAQLARHRRRLQPGAFTNGALVEPSGTTFVIDRLELPERN